MNERPFTTNDKRLASALVTAGCTPLACEDFGPATNTYTPDLLRNWGYLKGAVTIPEFEAIATICANGGILPDGRKIRKRLGIVAYHFIQDDIFQRAMKAWDACVQECINAENEKRAPHLNQKPTPEEIMQVVHAERMNDELLNKLAWIKPPECAIGGTKGHEEPIQSKNAVDGRMSHQGVNKTVYTGSFKRWTLGCSPEMRRDLNLDAK